MFTSLMYHRIGVKGGSKYDISFDVLNEQMDTLQKCGFCSYDISINTPPHQVIDNKQVLITFDDGHISNLEAARLLNSKGLKAVFYIVKDYCCSNGTYLTESMIKEISDMGHTIGIHGKSHTRWTDKTDEVLVNELSETKSWIESITGKECITCSAPFGFINKRVLKTITANFSSFKIIRTSDTRVNIGGDLVVGSVAIHKDTTLSEFKKIITGNRFYYFRNIVFWKMKEMAKKLLIHK